MSEAHSERVHPEQLRMLWVSSSDVAGDPFTESEPPKDAESTCEFHSAMRTFLFDTPRRNLVWEHVLVCLVLHTVNEPFHDLYVPPGNHSRNYTHPLRVSEGVLDSRSWW